jgi:hypothetical protein
MTGLLKIDRNEFWGKGGKEAQRQQQAEAPETVRPAYDEVM